MPSIDFNEYARTVRKQLEQVLAAGEAVSLTLRVEPQSSLRGFIEGEMRLENDGLLVLREYVDLTQDEARLMYAYYCQDATGALLFRYDNAAHRPRLPQSDHKHTLSGIELCAAPTLAQILRESLS